MLTKHPSAYKHQIAFTFSGSRRQLYQRARTAILADVGLKNWTAKLGIQLRDDCVFNEDDWGKQPAPEFYQSYDDALLIVVFFEESYRNSRGANPEWQTIQRGLLPLHGRILPVKFDSLASWNIDGSEFDGYHFNGSIDVQHCSDDDERLELIIPKILKVWQQLVSPWIFPPRNTIICFGEHTPEIRDTSTICIKLPDLDNIDKIAGTIEAGWPFLPTPLRSTCVYAPPECLQEEKWGIFERALGLISQAAKFRKRSSVYIPVFVPEDAITSDRRTLKDVIFMKNVANREIYSEWESDYRSHSSFGEWFSQVNKQPFINVVVGSAISKEDVKTWVRYYLDNQHDDLIVNVWHWKDGSVYKSLKYFDADMAGLYHAAKEAESKLPIGSNLIYNTLENSKDLHSGVAGTSWYDDPHTTFQKIVLQVLCSKPFSFQLVNPKLKRRKKTL